MNIFKIFWKNRQSFLLALFLSVGVWISTVISEDPNKQDILSNEVAIEVIGLPDSMEVVSDIPYSIQLEILAPQSIWNEVDQNMSLIKAELDLSGLESGAYFVKLNVEVDAYPVQIISFSPDAFEVKIEKLQTEIFPIRIKVNGEPALGFQSELPNPNVLQISASGPESLISSIEEMIAEIDISGIRESVIYEVVLNPVDADGKRIVGIKLSPNIISINQVITQSGGYRDVAVIVETTGEPEKGYRVTNISKSPPTVTLFSSDPLLVAAMPGFVSTVPLNLEGAIDDIEALLTLDLPEGITLVGDNQAITVQIGIGAIEDTILIEVPVEVIGLGPDLSAELSPGMIEIFLSGPLSVLDELLPTDIHIFVNLTDFTVGSYLVTPEEEVIPTRLTLESINPDTIEVIITESLEETSTDSIP